MYSIRGRLYEARDRLSSILQGRCRLDERSPYVLGMEEPTTNVNRRRFPDDVLVIRALPEEAFCVGEKERARARDRSRFLTGASPPGESSPPLFWQTNPPLVDASVSPAGSHRARWCAHPVAPPSDQDPGAPPPTTRAARLWYPPSVVGTVRASVQRSRELLRETGVDWSAREG